MEVRQGTFSLVGETTEVIYGLPAAEWQARNWGKAGVAQARGAVLARVEWVFSAGLTAAVVAAENVALVVGTPAGLHLVAAHIGAGSAIDPAAVVALMSAGAQREEEIAALGLRVQTPEALAGGYSVKLRKRETPFALPIKDGGVREAEKALFKSAYKGATDLVTKYVWPAPALAVTRFCAARHISPNTVTAVSLLLVLIATWAFWRGDWAVGFFFGWLMTFLDTVDGKLARTTLTSSRVGHNFDHGIDWIHPPFWYVAWYYGILNTTAPAPGWLGMALAIILVGYVLGRAIETAFKIVHGFNMHIWHRFDYVLRIITARRNPNMLIFMVFTLFGAPAAGFGAVAVWTVICVTLHAIRLVSAGLRPADPPLRSWMAA